MERKSPWCPACLDYKGEENELHTCTECGIKGFACCVPGPGQLCVNCYEKRERTGGIGIKVSELVRRVVFFRRQRAMLLGMADDHEREAVRVLALLRHQGVENPSQTHRWGCCNSEEMHCHEAPACCSSKCWCQREAQRAWGLLSLLRGSTNGSEGTDGKPFRTALYRPEVRPQMP